MTSPSGDPLLAVAVNRVKRRLKKGADPLVRILGDELVPLRNEIVRLKQLLQTARNEIQKLKRESKAWTGINDFKTTPGRAGRIESRTKPC